ncbi:MAG: NfeD family protein [Polyangiaceae bacterium]
MIVLYIAALVASAGAVLLQIMAGHGDVGDGAAGGHDVGPTHDADHDAGLWSLVASVRFWSFLLLAFGLVGTLLTLFQLAGPAVTFGLALASGFASGTFAVTVIRRLLSRSASSNVKRGEGVVGRLGKVIVPLSPDGRGKIRVEVKGSVVDYVARASEAISEGDAVIIEEYEDSEVVVSRAPAELKLKA